jgi:hypothetical protein
MKNIIAAGIIILWICTLLAVSCVSTPETSSPGDKGDSSPTLEPTEVPVKVEPTPVPTEEPTQTPSPTKTPGPQIGEFWFEVPGDPVGLETEFETKMFFNSGDKKIAAVGLEVTFDPEILTTNAEKGTSGVEPGPDGFVAAVNSSKPGILTIAGFDVFGKGPGEKLHFLTIYWKAVGRGESPVSIKVINAVDVTTADLGASKGLSAFITVK